MFEKSHEKLQKDKEQLEIVLSIYSETLSCQAPTTNYAVFLLERYLLLKIKVIKVGKSVAIETTPDLFKCFREHND